jgi:hypothetical protein
MAKKSHREPSPFPSSRVPAIAPGQEAHVERVALSIVLDPYLPLKALATCSGLSVRKLRDCLCNPNHPLPHYRVHGKILVRRSEFDAWIAVYRRAGDIDVDRILAEVLAELD